MIKLLSLFSGIGAFEKALCRLNIQFELVNYCEIDKYASKSYSLIHNIPETKNLWDITKINEKELTDFDLMTWGFPCQSLSIAGKRDGFVDIDGNKTKSGLYYDGIRILKEKRPKYSIIENVKSLTNLTFKKEFEQVMSDLSAAGYDSYWKILNSKDFDIPQRRERIFIVSIRKDLNRIYKFPEPMILTRTLKDYLDESVDESYYRIVPSMLKAIENKKCKVIPSDGVNNTITTKQERWNNAGFVEVLYREKTNKGLIRDGYSIYGIDGLCPTLKSSSSQRHENFLMEDKRLRYLTPRECFRLMGYDDIDFNKVETIISKTQLYKQAGNSIVVNVLEAILKELITN